ncbi:ribosomal RNA processing protein 1 homolog A-like [Sinocyclocheilus anshuiensis]|uniref:ribosomal RNA processing protein 1 homolog A-like n=1 Tax=Sinocyclocheilus anshuiensis TaxID=1608454 RepID=UPI0007BA638E|nr:PREDICTED: ribosomal RNA processing protein 1 homolog A-like [Sinocyclocheilus anshuiensis]
MAERRPAGGFQVSLVVLLITGLCFWDCRRNCRLKSLGSSTAFGRSTALVSEFLQILTAQLLQSSSAAPAGLVLHVLDLYLTELALIGSAELTAEQNQTFIEPFFKTVAKIKDRVLLKAIGSNIFNTIVDQVPYAIEDLQREIRQNAELDSSEEAEDEIPLKTLTPNSRYTPQYEYK